MTILRQQRVKKGKVILSSTYLFRRQWRIRTMASIADGVVKVLDV
jgi:hypothetical protein